MKILNQQFQRACSFYGFCLTSKVEQFTMARMLKSSYLPFPLSTNSMLPTTRKWLKRTWCPCKMRTFDFFKKRLKQLCHLHRKTKKLGRSTPILRLTSQILSSSRPLVPFERSREQPQSRCFLKKKCDENRQIQYEYHT